LPSNTRNCGPKRLRAKLITQKKFPKRKARKEGESNAREPKDEKKKPTH